MERWPTSNWRFWLLAACVIAAAALFLSLDWEKRFVSDVSALLPGAQKGDQTAELLSQVRQQQERLILGALLPPASGWSSLREETAVSFLESLRKSGRFETVAEGAGPSDPEALAATVYEGRLDLLLPYWAEKAGLSTREPDAEGWATAVVTSFEDFLTQPEATALADLLPSDPFPLAATMAEATPPGLNETDEQGPLLFWAVQIDSPFAPEGQSPVFEAINDAARDAAAILPGVQVRQASVAKFAAESERRIRREITLLNVFSILLVALVALVFLRRKIVLFHLLLIAVLSVAGGLVAALLLFPTVHILTLVVGGLLVGVAVDYGIHILLHRHESPGTGFLQTLHEVRKPLLASALSTAAGFGALAFGDLPLLQQIGVFVAGGLLAALAASWLYLPLWPRPEALSSFAEPKNSVRPRRWILLLGAGIFILPLAGWLRLEWHDDIRELQPPMPGLWESDAEVRDLFSGDARNAASWICIGETPREARKALAAFEAKWQESGEEKATLFSLAPWVAEPAASDAVRALFLAMPEFEATLTEKLEEAGFEADAFAPFFSTLREWLSPEAPNYEERLRAVASTLDGPSGLLFRGGPSGWFFLVSVPEESIPPDWQPPAGTIATAQIETLNELFSQYRQTAWRLSGISLAIIAAGVLLAYRRAAGATLLLPILAWAWGMGVLGGIASPLSLFHVLGGFLGFCVALDYGLFFHHAREAKRVLPGSIRVSAATTLSAFGVLSCASIPAVAALGMSVFLVVFAALFMVEMLNAWQASVQRKISA